MGATTGGGMLAMAGMAGGKPSMASMMRLATSGIPTEGRSLLLKLGSTLRRQGRAGGIPHDAGGRAGQQADLPGDAGGRAGVSGPSTPGGTYTQPKGQIKFYWGCGETAGPGQPVVLTFDKLVRGENDPALEALEGSVSARGVRKPEPGNSKTYGDWPHGDRKKKNNGLEATFPTGSTLAGQHVIEGTYSPKIDFTLPADKTFMEAVRYTSTGVLPSGAIGLSWTAPARATGYSLGVMAPERVGDDTANIIMWSSAERPATFIQMEDLTPAEVNRLIGLKAVLPASTTNCAVPAEVVKATKDGSMLMFTAFGDEATFIHPARPADPKVPWDQEWFARVSFKSARMDMVSPQGVMDLGSMSGGGYVGHGPGCDVGRGVLQADRCAGSGEAVGGRRGPRRPAAQRARAQEARAAVGDRSALRPEEVGRAFRRSSAGQSFSSAWRQLERAARRSIGGGNHLAAAHERAQRRRDHHRAVLLLVVLEDRDQGAAHRQAGAVQRVHELGLAGALRPVLDVGAAGLERLAVRARRDLAVGLLARQPDLDVVGLGGLEAHVAGGQAHRAIRQLEPLEHFLGVRGQRLELVVALLGRRELHQLHLVELVLADQAADVGAVRAGLAAEARRVGGVLDRQQAAVEDLVAIQIGDRHFGGRDQVEVPVAVDLEEVRLELRQLAGAEQGGAVDQERRLHLGVAVLGRRAASA